MYSDGTGRFYSPAPDTEFRDLAICFPKIVTGRLKKVREACTPGSMNSLFGELFRDFWIPILGCSGLFRVDIGRFLEEK